MAKFVGAHVYQNANQNVNDSAWTPLTFNTERYDTDTIHDAGTPTRLTCVTAGTYLIIGRVVWDNNQVNSRYLTIKLDNATNIAYNQRNANAAGTMNQDVSTIYVLAVGQYVELCVYQDSGGVRTVDYSSACSPEFMMQRIG